MPEVLPHLLCLYRVLLCAYPAELRRNYGQEMEEAFGQLLRAEWKSRGTRGAAWTMGRAISELFTVAIPGHIARDWVIATGLSLVINVAVLALLVGIMMRPVLSFR